VRWYLRTYGDPIQSAAFRPGVNKIGSCAKILFNQWRNEDPPCYRLGHRQAFTKSAQEPQNYDAVWLLDPVEQPVRSRIAISSWAKDTDKTQGSDMIEAILQNYQSVVGIITVLSPFIILFLTNNHASRLKKLEIELAIQQKRLEMEMGAALEASGKELDHENVVLSSLVDILFKVQKLHIDIACGQDDMGCIDRATTEFQNSLSKHQAITSDNQLYLTSQIIHHLYRFYSQLAALFVELQDLKRTGQLDLAIACVYDYAQQLADEIVEIQSSVVQRRKGLAVEFEKEHIKMMRYCCGVEPNPEVKARYERLKKKGA
jgi:hypothetical protein